MSLEQDNRVEAKVRLPKELHDELVRIAEERDVSVNFLFNRAIEDYIPRLIPIDELKRQTVSNYISRHERRDPIRLPYIPGIKESKPKLDT